MQASWDDCNIWVQAQMIAYNQTREYEESKEKCELAKAMVPRL